MPPDRIFPNTRCSVLTTLSVRFLTNRRVKNDRTLPCADLMLFYTEHHLFCPRRASVKNSRGPWRNVACEMAHIPRRNSKNKLYPSSAMKKNTSTFRRRLYILCAAVRRPRVCAMCQRNTRRFSMPLHYSIILFLPTHTTFCTRGTEYHLLGSLSKTSTCRV